LVRASFRIGRILMRAARAIGSRLARIDGRSSLVFPAHSLGAHVASRGGGRTHGAARGAGGRRGASRRPVRVATVFIDAIARRREGLAPPPLARVGARARRRLC